MRISNEELVSRKYQRCIACMIRNITKFAAVQDYKNGIQMTNCKVKCNGKIKKKTHKD